MSAERCPCKSLISRTPRSSARCCVDCSVIILFSQVLVLSSNYLMVFIVQSLKKGRSSREKIMHNEKRDCRTHKRQKYHI